MQALYLISLGVFMTPLVHSHLVFTQIGYNHLMPGLKGGLTHAVKLDLGQM